MTKRFNGEVAIVTGATSGIGKATACLLAKQGARVVVVGRNKEEGNHIQNEILKEGGVAKFIYCDVSKEEDVKNLIAQTMETYGQLDFLVNNAGIFYTGPIEKIDVESWDKMYSTNVRGTFLMCKEALPYLEKSARAAVVNNASIAGMQSYCTGRSYIYSSSKAAVIQFSNVMAQNHAQSVRVNCICPGIIETPMLGDRNRDVYVERVPMKRLGEVEEVANVISFLLSDEASYVTGAVIPIDGGVSI